MKSSPPQDDDDDFCDEEIDDCDIGTSRNKVKKGWLKKQGRSGFLKSWTERYFVLNSGTLSYYENEHHMLPYGTELKVSLIRLPSAVVHWLIDDADDTDVMTCTTTYCTIGRHVPYQD